MKRAKLTPKAKLAPISPGPIWPMLGRFRQKLAKTALGGTDWAPLISELVHTKFYFGTFSQFGPSKSQIGNANLAPTRDNMVQYQLHTKRSSHV